METYDVIVIGGGHNALVSAAYLTKAGRSVLVLDKNDRPGGFVRTDEILPGYRYDPYSASHPLFTIGPAYAHFGKDLEARGLRYINTDLPTGVSMEDGTTAVMPRTPEAIVREADRLALGDGAVFAAMLEDFAFYAQDVFSLFAQDLASPEADEIIGRLVRSGGGPGYSAFAASLFDTARNVVSRFRSSAMRSMLGSWPTHVSKGPDEVGGGLWVKLFVLALMGGGMPIPEGGSEKLAEALARLVADQGGVIRTDSLVRRITVEDGRATGVVTAHGESYRATEHVIASVNPDQLYLTLLSDADVPAPLTTQARGFRYGRGGVQIHLALSEPPRWPDERFENIGQPILTDSLDGLALHVAQGLAGLLPTRPTFTVDVPTSRDASRAPEHKAVMRVQLTDIPTRPRDDAAGTIEVGDGTWTPDLIDRFVERVLVLVGKHVRNVPDAIVGHRVTTPDTLSQHNPNAGPGDPYGGAQDLAQSFFFRPLPGQPSHRTFIPNLYTLGAATWPGGGVSGGSGYIVAQQLLGSGVRSAAR
jgi:phytoene dehydrogenase-like protein